MGISTASGINTGHGYQHVPSGSMDHGLQQGFRRLHRLWTSTWPLVVTGTINMASSNCTDCGHPPGLWLQHEPETKTWPPAILQTVDLNGPQLQHEPHTTSWPLVAVHLLSITCISNLHRHRKIKRDLPLIFYIGNTICLSLNQSQKQSRQAASYPLPLVPGYI